MAPRCTDDDDDDDDARDIGADDISDGICFGDNANGDIAPTTTQEATGGIIGTAATTEMMTSATTTLMMTATSLSYVCKVNRAFKALGLDD